MPEQKYKAEDFVVCFRCFKKRHKIWMYTTKIPGVYLCSACAEYKRLVIDRDHDTGEDE